MSDMPQLLKPLPQERRTGEGRIALEQYPRLKARFSDQFDIGQ